MRRGRIRVLQQDLGAVFASSRNEEQDRAGGLKVFSAVLLVAVLVAAGLTIKLHHAPAPVSPAGPATHALVVLIDGASPDDLSSVSLPHLQALVRRGVTYNNAWVGQVQADPVTSGATIGTGVYPREHGIIGPTWTNPQTGRPSDALTPQQVHLGSLDQIMLARHVPTLAGALKGRYSGARVLAVGGAGCAAPAAAGTWLADFILCPERDGKRWAPAGVAGHLAPTGPLQDLRWSVPAASGTSVGAAAEGWAPGQQDRWIGRYAVAAMRITRPAITIVDFPEIRLLAPYVSPDQRPALIRRLLQGIDASIGALEAELQREHNARRTVFVVTAGSSISAANDTLPRSALHDSVLAAGGQDVYISADGSAMLGLQDPNQAQPVAQALQAAHLPQVDAIYTKAQQGSSVSYSAQYLNPELPRSFPDAMQYLLSTTATDRSPDVAVIYAPHITTSSRIASYSRQASTNGFQWDTQHVPLILSGDGVYSGGFSDYPARLADIAPTLEAVLGLTIQGQDGVVLADALTYPPGGSAGRQDAARHQLQPFIQALRQRIAGG